MIMALVGIAGERGAGAVTVAHIVARSGVSRRTFYELFKDCEDCFLAAFEVAIERAADRVVPAYSGSGSWRERMRAGLGALLEFFEDEPGMGRLCVVDALGAGPVALERRARVVDVLIDAVHEGGGDARPGARPTRLTAEGVVGAVLGVLHARLAKAEGMAGLLGPLMGMIVLPYQGKAAATRETSRPGPRRREPARKSGDPLRELDMRLTYRTVRVLLAIAELGDYGSMDGLGASGPMGDRGSGSGRGATGPMGDRGSGDGQGAKPSNREVAAASGVSDQGQISKLLARLEHVGLIRNDGAGPSSGEPNAWSLTPKGQEIEHMLRCQATPAG
jgi:AcrR family transcriptional regulator